MLRDRRARPIRAARRAHRDWWRRRVWRQPPSAAQRRARRPPPHRVVRRSRDSSRRLQSNRLEQERVGSVQLRRAQNSIGEAQRDICGETAVERHRLAEAEGCAVDFAGFEWRTLIEDDGAGKGLFVEAGAILQRSHEDTSFFLDLASEQLERVVVRELLLHCSNGYYSCRIFAALHLLE